jgi:hypothetical protein
MRLPTSYNPPLAHRANPVLPRPRTVLLPSSIEQPKPRAAISSLLSLPSHQPHGANGASPTPIGRPTFSSARTHDDDHHQRTSREYNHNHHYDGANRREPSPPPSPTARSVVSQPPMTPGGGGGGGGDSEAARVSLWAELKDIRRRSRTPGASMVKEPSSA